MSSPLITLQATGTSLLGNATPITLRLQLIDPSESGGLKVVGTGIVPSNILGSNAAPSTTASAGPFYGNDVIEDANNNVGITYYHVEVIGPPYGSGFLSNVVFEGNYQFAGSGTTDLLIAAQYNPPPALGVSANILSSDNIFTGIETFANINGMVIVDGVTYPQTDTGILAAINACSDGGTVYMPVGVYTILGTIPITKRINIVGAGWGTNLQVGSAVSAATDVFHVIPSAYVEGMRFQDFRISPQSGTPGRYGINIDGTTAALGYLVIDHLEINLLGNYSIAVTNASGQASGTPFTTEITGECALLGGINLTNAGDSVNIKNCTLTGPRDLLVDLIPGASDGGPHGLNICDNNITLTGGIIIRNAWQGSFSRNNIEQIANTTSSNTCLLDIQGTAGTNIENFVVEHNYLGGSGGFNLTTTVRVDRATGTIFRDNYVGRAVGGTSYLITSNADRTQIKDWTVPTNELITVWLVDNGTNTQVDYLNATTGVRTLAGFPALAVGIPSVSAPNFAFAGVQARAGNSSIWGFSSGADPTTAGLDTGFSRLSAKVVALGNGTQSEISGTLAVAALRNSLLGTVINSSTPVALGPAISRGLVVIADLTSGGVALVLVDAASSPALVIASNTATTAFVTTSPSATQIQLSIDGSFIVHALAGSSRNSDHIGFMHHILLNS